MIPMSNCKSTVSLSRTVKRAEEILRPDLFSMSNNLSDLSTLIFVTNLHRPA